MRFLSIVVPVYNEEVVLDELYSRLTAVLNGQPFDYEVVLVNDGSTDQTLAKARELCRKDQRIKLLSFSRNFGHQIAVTAGIDKASGQVIVIIDADLQDPPEVIIDMVEKWKQGYQVVYGVRKQRQRERWFKRASAALFYRLLRRLTSVDIPVDTGDFRLLDRKVVTQLTQMREHHRFVRGMVSWVGFKQGQVEYIREGRFAGTSKYPFSKMLNFALDGIFSFSSIPLKLSSLLGLVCSGLSFVLILFGLISKYFYPQTTIPGWASVFIAVLFLGGVQLITVGILGEYIARVYEEVKRRPLYVVEEEINFE